jgi:transketolase
MRKEFSATVETLSKTKPELVFLTGDLGFMALENVRAAMGERFVNVGVCEQNMISMAAAMAHEGLQVICYSIAPFAVFRPAEQIRLDVCLHKKNVKIAGNGGGYGYGIMGATHHAIEDIAVMSAFQYMRCYIPLCNEDVEGAVKTMLHHEHPAYLRLGYGLLPEGWNLPEFAPIRKLACGNKLTIAGMGPVLLNAAKAFEHDGDADIFVVSELPLHILSKEFLQSVAETGKLLVVEEHVERGGLGEHLALHLLKSGICCKLFHHCARGYENGRYGSQKYHQKQNRLDRDALQQTITNIINGQSDTL